jgi:hypothetical protein
MFAHHEPEHGGREEDPDGSNRRREQDPVAGVRDGGGVVHDPIDGISDSLVVKRRHGKTLDPLEQERTVVMVQRLGQPKRPAKLEQAEKTAGKAVAVVGLILRPGGGVVSPLEVGSRLISLPARRSESPHDRDEKRLEGDGPEEDLRCRGVDQRREKGPQEERVGRELRAKRDPSDHVVDQNLDRPGKQEQGSQAQERESRLDGETNAERPDVAEPLCKEPQRFARRDGLRLLQALSHRASSGRARPPG